MTNPHNSFMQQTYNATLVSYPDLYLTEDAPKIFFVGSGKEWKAKAVNHFSNNWLEAPIVMYFYEGETTAEILPWIYYNLTNADFILFHLDDMSAGLDLLLLGILAHKPNVYISATKTEGTKMFRILCSEFNNHIITDTAEERLEILKKLWTSN